MTQHYSDFFELIEQNGVVITSEQKKKIEIRINEFLSYEPKIGFFGKTGVGKSSLCNALFGQEVFAISDVEACTRDSKEILLSLGKKGIKLVDVPGVGESRERDQEYAKLYKQLLPELDVVLWVLKADDRAYTSDHDFYTNVVLPHIEQGKPFFFVLNQSDKIEPFREWDEEARRPGPKQSANLEAKVQSVADIFNFPSSKVIQVSANERYNLVKLIDEIVFALPKEKQVTFVDQVKDENISDDTREKASNAFSDVVIDMFIDFAPILPIMKDPIRRGVKFLVNKVKGWFKW